ncbi:uncharacterized protein LOC129580316 [Sitodiplosis mosellana]|uniref:uncharacterized protein LOC129580316 n=1 Tax=Sitodiplosis mosellana TaxID=263140 RepID=UPI00244400CF|nr:uncharacterized protein LOC129580316 [Sitodiplosis mosellana]
MPKIKSRSQHRKITQYLTKPAHKANALSVASNSNSDVEQIYGLKPVFVKVVNLSKHEICEIQKKIESGDKVKSAVVNDTLTARLIEFSAKNVVPVQKKIKSKDEVGSAVDMSTPRPNEAKNDEPVQKKIEKGQKTGNVNTTRLTRSRARSLGINVNDIQTSSSNKTMKRKICRVEDNESREESSSKKRKLDDKQIHEAPQQIAQNSIDDPQLVKTVAQIIFKVDEVVWAKIKGHPHWPARIKCFPSAKMAIVVWFNDYRTTKIYRTQLHKFLTNFDKFAVRFRDTIGLETAAKEGLIYYGQRANAAMQF